MATSNVQRLSEKYGPAGGYLVGRPHTKGGIKAKIRGNGQPIEMQGGEIVITAPAVVDNKKREFEGQMLTNKQILSRINVGGGGVSFEHGGQVPKKIRVSGKSYNYGGKTMSDRDIVSSCGCKHAQAKLEKGGQVNKVPELMSMRERELSNEIKGYQNLRRIESQDGGYIKTDETINDNDYGTDEPEFLRTKAYKVKYAVKWNDLETSADPDIEWFNSIDKAFDASQQPGEWWNGGIDHMNRIILEPVEVWLDNEGEEFEEGSVVTLDDLLPEHKKTVLARIGLTEDKFGTSEELYAKNFGARDDNAEELEDHARRNLGNDLEQEYEADNGKTYKIEHSGSGKYSSLSIINPEGDIIGSVQLRVTNHTYNPSNNDSSAQEGNFISVEIANVNATKERYHTRYSLQFDGEDSYEEVLQKTQERLLEILDSWDFEQLDSTTSFAKGGEVPSQDIEMSKAEFMKLLIPLELFLSFGQSDILRQIFSGEEKQEAINIVTRLTDIIKKLPKTYGTQKQTAEDKIVYLHYFAGNSDWYVVEKDVEPEQLQAFGYVILNGYLMDAEWGYISIVELQKHRKVELDWHFEPITFGDLRKKWEGEDYPDFIIDGDSPIEGPKIKLWAIRGMNAVLWYAENLKELKDYALKEYGITIDDNSAEKFKFELVTEDFEQIEGGMTLEFVFMPENKNVFFIEGSIDFNGSVRDGFDIKPYYTDGEIRDKKGIIDMLIKKEGEKWLLRNGWAKAPQKDVSASTLPNYSKDNPSWNAPGPLKGEVTGRKATNYTAKATGTYGLGNNQKPVEGTANQVVIDNYGTVTSQAFINKLVENGRLPVEYLKKRTQVFSNEFLTDMLNKNEDLFPVDESIKSINPDIESILPPAVRKKSDQYRINNEIRDLVQQKGINSTDYSPDQLAFLMQYEGAGGLIKEGESGARILDQFFTPMQICQKMWGLALKYGFSFKNARICEPAVGTGRFLKFIPSDINTHVTAFEIDETSYKICKILYPDFDIRFESFETMFFKGTRHIGLAGVDEFYDLVIGNPPYRDYVSKYAPLGEKAATGAFTFEMYFIMRGIDILKPGGLLIYIIPNTFLSNDSKYNSFKEQLSRKAELIDAYRLPNGVFDNTAVGTDIIILKKNP